jgi:hypothetical protein
MLLQEKNEQEVDYEEKLRQVRAGAMGKQSADTAAVWLRRHLCDMLACVVGLQWSNLMCPRVSAILVPYGEAS